MNPRTFRALATALLALLALASPVLSYSAPPAHANACRKGHNPHCPPPVAASGVTIDTATGTLNGFGLVPGTVYHASFEFTPDGATQPNWFVGWGAVGVRSDGTISFPNELRDVDPGLVPGTLHAWMHEGVDFNSPPAVGPDGTVLETSAHLL